MNEKIKEIRRKNASLLLSIIHADCTEDYKAIMEAQKEISKELDELEAIYGVEKVDDALDELETTNEDDENC